jgi:hypothetical protein
VENAIALVLLTGHEIVSVPTIIPSGARYTVVFPVVIVEVWLPISYVVPPITISSNVEVNCDGDKDGDELIEPLSETGADEVVVKVSDTWMIFVIEASQL